MNHFAAYARRANTIAKHHPAPLVGVTKTRREAMVVYSEIVDEIRACGDENMLTAYLASIPHHIAQFKAELPFLWSGDGADFVGIAGEIQLRRDQFQAEPEGETERLFGQF